MCYENATHKKQAFVAVVCLDFTGNNGLKSYRGGICANADHFDQSG